MNDNGKGTIVFVYPARLWPVQGGGAMRAWSMIAYLRECGWRAALVTIPHGEHAGELERRVDSLYMPGAGGSVGVASMVKTVARTLPLPRSLRRAGRRILHGGSGSVLDASRVPALEVLAGQVAGKLSARAMIAAYAYTAPALDAAPEGCLRIVDSMDVQHLRAASWIETTARSAGAICTPDEEAAYLNRAEVILAIQDEEANTLRNLCRECEVVTIPHAAPDIAYTPSPAASRDVLFVGNLYGPNVEGINRFIEVCWPSIQERIPDVSLTVCGRVSEAVPNTPGVRRMGIVDTLDTLYRQAGVVIAPIIGGTGFKIKTLEALAHGRCIIGTDDALCGFRDDSPPPVAIHTIGESFADRVAALLTDPAARHAREQEGQLFARTEYGAERVYAPLVELLERG